ncbi:phosphatase PAP2 family protein [Zhongshania guokunii]|uniref:Phosphatase PAP2 family protein n=1 Tax=Zhongshania guokunii TaxID=641783 RepID=A0ABV3U680_9GAMM
MRPAKHIQYSLLALLTCTICFELTPLDTWVQDLFYNSQSQQWALSIKGSPVRHFILYDGPKKLLILFEVALLLSLLFFRKHPIVKQYHCGLLIVLLSLPLGPAAVSSLKGTTNVACPYALSQYGGDIPYIKVFERYPTGQEPSKQQRCFPAGHASGGFALMALYYLPKSRRRRQQALYFAIGAGWIMGGYKMLLGHHFLSHTIISMLISWLVVNCVAQMVIPHKTLERSSPSDSKSGSLLTIASPD